MTSADLAGTRPCAWPASACVCRSLRSMTASAAHSSNRLFPSWNGKIGFSEDAVGSLLQPFGHPSRTSRTPFAHAASEALPWQPTNRDSGSSSAANLRVFRQPSAASRLHGLEGWQRFGSSSSSANAYQPPSSEYGRWARQAGIVHATGWQPCGLSTSDTNDDSSSWLDQIAPSASRHGRSPASGRQLLPSLDGQWPAALSMSSSSRASSPALLSLSSMSREPRARPLNVSPSCSILRWK